MSNLKNKNLLVICDGYPSKDNKTFSGMFVKQQIKYIAPHFNKVFVISPTPFFPKILKNITIFPKRYTDSAKLENYEYENIKVYFPKFVTLPFPKYYQKHKNKLFYNSCLKVINKNKLKFDLIHAHFTKPAGYIASIFQKNYNIPYLLTVHEDTVWLNKDILNDKNCIDVFKSANKIIRVNTKDLFKIKKYNTNTIFIPNGYDFNIFYNKGLKKKLAPQKIICIGNLVINQKNQINLIKAMKNVINNNLDVQLSIVGVGVDYNKINTEIKIQNLENKVKLLGAKTPKEINDLLNESDLFILPSYSESFGIVQIEAMACGVPVVATINGGSEEIITSSDVGLLVKDPENIKELAATIEKALNTNWDAKKIIDFVKKYSLENISKEIIQEYKKIIK